jgi:hypothetical protein
MGAMTAVVIPPNSAVYKIRKADQPPVKVRMVPYACVKHSHGNVICCNLTLNLISASNLFSHTIHGISPQKNSRL